MFLVILDKHLIIGPHFFTDFRPLKSLGRHCRSNLQNTRIHPQIIGSTEIVQLVNYYYGTLCSKEFRKLKESTIHRPVIDQIWRGNSG